jgi:hypothetical protein
MWKEFYKDGKVYTVETRHVFFGVKSREAELMEQGYEPVFDRRRLHYLNGKGGTVILENALVAPYYLTQFQKEIDAYHGKNHTSKIYTCIHPGHVPQINQLIKDHQVKNVIIDSLFEDRVQFRALIIKLFCNHTDVNFFINSRNTLVDVLNDELTHYMAKYPVRNSYYKNFNDLTFTILKNHIYEMNFSETDEMGIDAMTKIDISDARDKVAYGQRYKFMFGNYDSDNSDICPPDKKSKWDIE